MTTANVLGDDHRPRFFRVGNAAALGLVAPDSQAGLVRRTYARSLGGMQKEAVVVSGATGAAWRLVSDEGPYLAGHDEAPVPLAFMSAGLVASCFTAFARLCRGWGMAARDLRVSLDSPYGMEGSALRGTMLASALPPTLRVAVTVGPKGLRAGDARALHVDAVAASLLGCIVGDSSASRFTLTHNGRRVSIGRLHGMSRSVSDSVADMLDRITVDGPAEPDTLVHRTGGDWQRRREAERAPNATSDQQRILKLRATCTPRSDGVQQIEVEPLIPPQGTTYRFLADEPLDNGPGRAPDPATLVSAGLAFCFMTQLARYADMTRIRLDHCAVVQDSRFLVGGSPARGNAGRGRSCSTAVDTHVHLASGDDDGVGRRLVEMGEQTCFLHALLRANVDVELVIAVTEKVEMP